MILNKLVHCLDTREFSELLTDCAHRLVMMDRVEDARRLRDIADSIESGRVASLPLLNAEEVAMVSIGDVTNKIKAIKAYRERTGASLIDAKRLVDSVRLSAVRK